MAGNLKGLIPVTGGKSGQIRTLEFTTGGEVFRYSPVVLTTSNTVTVPGAANTGGLLIGVAMHYAASGATVLVAVDPEQEFVTTPDAAFANASDAMGRLYPGVGFGTGDATRQISDFQLDESAGTTTPSTTNCYLVVRLHRTLDNDWDNDVGGTDDDNARVIVKVHPDAHYFAHGVGV